MTFGEALRRRREALGMQQKDVALRCEISPQYLSDLERNMRTPSDYCLHMLCGDLGLSYAYCCVLLGKLPMGLWATLKLQTVDPEQADAAWVAFAHALGVEVSRT